MKEGQKGYFYNFTSKIAFKKKKKKNLKFQKVLLSFP